VRRAAKTDGNQQAIVDALRSVAVQVEVIGKPLDLLCCVRGETLLVEVKNPDGSDSFTKAQVEFISRWPGRIETVRSPDEAIRLVLGEAVLR
jgi:hypothetical protein